MQSIPQRSFSLNAARLFPPLLGLVVTLVLGSTQWAPALQRNLLCDHPHIAKAVRRTQIQRSTLVLCLFLFALGTATRWLRLNLSPSLPCGLYRLGAVPVEVPRGALVVLPVPASVQHVWPSWVPLLKPVAAVPGDRVCYQEGRLQVNAIDYGPVYLDTHGKALPHMDAGCQTIPAGMVFLASQAAKSMDSRYFSSVAIVNLTAQASPVLTWR